MKSEINSKKNSNRSKTEFIAQLIYFILVITMLLISLACAQPRNPVFQKDSHQSDTDRFPDDVVKSWYAQNNHDIEGFDADPDIPANVRLFISSIEVPERTRFSDRSGSRHVIKAHGDVTSASPISGTGKAIRFDGDGDYLSIADAEAWDFKNHDFTIDFWINFIEQPKLYDGILSTYTRKADHGYWLYIYNETIQFGSLDIGLIDTRFIPVPGQWLHLAVVRAGNNLTIYIDGKSCVTRDCSDARFYSSDQTLVIGRLFTAIDGWYFKGYMNDISVSDVARWTKNFTPPEMEQP